METQRTKPLRRMITFFLSVWGILAVWNIADLLMYRNVSDYVTFNLMVVAFALSFLCGLVFFVRILRGLPTGKIFLPGNAKWLYLIAIFVFGYEMAIDLMKPEAGGFDSLQTARALVKPMKYVTFIVIALMGLFYQAATDVSEENQLTV